MRAPSPPAQYHAPQRQPEKRKRRWDEEQPIAVKRPAPEPGQILTPNSFNLQPAAQAPAPDVPAPAMEPMARSGSSAPVVPPLPDWATISRIQSMAARASELWPPHQSSSSSLDSPIDFVLCVGSTSIWLTVSYKERLARREWTPQWLCVHGAERRR